jgi:hypothetical protein
MGPRLRPTNGMIREYLSKLGFTAHPAEKEHTLYRYLDPDQFLLLRLDNDDEPVRELNLVVTRKFLTEWGLVTDDEFDQFLVESILARYNPPPEPHIRTA